MKPAARTKLLALAPTAATKAALAPVAEACELACVADRAALEAALAASGAVSLVLVELEEATPPLEELGRLVKARAPGATLLGATCRRARFDRTRAVAAGFQDLFLLPLEDAFLTRALAAAVEKASGGLARVYRPVRLSDLTIGAAAPCRLFVFLAANAKYVQFIDAGTVFTDEHLARLQAKGLNALHATVEDLPAFYAQATAAARAVDKAARMGLSQRRHLFEDGVREQVSKLFRGSEPPDEASGAALSENLFGLVRACLLELPRQGLGELVASAMGQLSDGYSHALNTATYAALFAMACELGNPGEAAIAALLHDLGELDGAGPGHVEATLSLLSSHHVTLSRNVERAIAQHHERFDGKGYPNGLGAAGVVPEAMAVAAADRFDELTRAVPGVAARPAAELMAQFRAAMLEKDPGALDPGLVEKISALLTK